MIMKIQTGFPLAYPVDGSSKVVTKILKDSAVQISGRTNNISNLCNGNMIVFNEFISAIGKFNITTSTDVKYSVVFPEYVSGQKTLTAFVSILSENTTSDLSSRYGRYDIMWRETLGNLEVPGSIIENINLNYIDHVCDTMWAKSSSKSGHAILCVPYAVVQYDIDKLSIGVKEIESSGTALDISVARKFKRTIRDVLASGGKHPIDLFATKRCMYLGAPNSLSMPMLVSARVPINMNAAPTQWVHSIKKLVMNRLMFIRTGNLGKINSRVLRCAILAPNGAVLLHKWADRNRAFKPYVDAYLGHITPEAAKAEGVIFALDGRDNGPTGFVPSWYDGIFRYDRKA